MDGDDDFPDIPLDNFGADTNVATPPVEEPKTESEANANGSEDKQEAQPAKAEDNAKAESATVEQAVKDGEDKQEPEASQQAGRPEKKDRVQSRIDEITRKNYEQAAYIQKLEAETARMEAMRGVKPLQPDDNGFVDPQALQTFVTQTAQAQNAAQMAVMNQRLEREQIATRINQEGAEIMSRYKDILDSDPVHQEALTALIEDRITDNLHSTARLREISPLKIAERYFAGVEAAEKRAEARAQQNLQALQADSVVEQNGSAQVDDADSLDALEARVADIKF